MNLQQRVRKGFLIVLKHVLNPVTRRIARSPIGPFALVRHVGRRSGKLYETPIIVTPTQGGFVIELSYGRDVDWHKNVLAAGGCTIIRHGREYVINNIEPLDANAGRAAFPMPERLILRLLHKKEFEKMRFQPA